MARYPNIIGVRLSDADVEKLTELRQGEYADRTNGEVLRDLLRQAPAVETTQRTSQDSPGQAEHAQK